MTARDCAIIQSISLDRCEKSYNDMGRPIKATIEVLLFGNIRQYADAIFTSENSAEALYEMIGRHIVTPKKEVKDD